MNSRTKDKNIATLASPRATLMSRSLDVTSLRALLRKDQGSPITTKIQARLQRSGFKNAAFDSGNTGNEKNAQAPVLTSSIQDGGRLKVRSVQTYESTSIASRFSVTSPLMSASMTSFRSKPVQEMPTLTEESPAFVKKQKIRFYVSSRSLGRKKVALKHRKLEDKGI